MTKAVRGIGYFLLSLAVVLAVMHWLNMAHVRELQNDDWLPEDFETAQYTLSGIQEDESRKGFSFSLHVPPEVQSAMLTVVDATRFQLYHNGVHIYSYTEQEPYQKVIQIPLTFEGEGALQTFFFSSPEWDRALAVNPMGLTIPKIKLLIGGNVYSQHQLSYAFGVSAILLGMLLLLSLSALYSYFLKRDQEYLLLLSFVALVSALHTAISMPVPLLPLKSAVYLKIRMPIVVSTLIPHAGLPLFLVKDGFPKKIRSLISTRNIILATIVTVLLQAVQPYSIYHMLRWSCLLGCAFMIIRYTGNRAHAMILLSAVSCCFGTYLYVYMTSTLHLFASSALLMYIRFTEVGYSASLLLNGLIIVQKYSLKFIEAEQLNAKLWAANRDLRNAVSIAKGELRQEQEHRRELMMNIFHDLRSPLFVLQGYTDKLADLNPEGQEMLSAFKNQLTFINRLVEDLFYLSCYESHELIFDFTPGDVGELLRATVADCRLSAAMKQVDLREEIDATGIIWCDKFHIQRTFRNILNNAIRHTPGGGTIYISTQLGENQIAVRFVDTGPGIGQSDIDHIFDRYYRGVNEPNGGGSQGLGLSIAREIVQAHRGSISAGNAPGKGAQIQIILPLWRESPPENGSLELAP